MTNNSKGQSVPINKDVMRLMSDDANKSTQSNNITQSRGN